MQGSSLYRRWRPHRFEDVVGQEHVITTLRHAILRDQVAHAYIFAGPRGTGKTTVARLLAKAVNCPAASEANGEPCDACEFCEDISGGSSMNIVEMDAASHRGIDDIRDLQERVPYASIHGRFRVYILDEAHMLTPEAFNALLKTLEEPPEHVIFVLATTEPHKIPVTIQSRCQRFDFRFLTLPEIVGRLEQVVAGDEGLSVSKPALWAIAEAAGGSVRDALSLLEQCRDYADGMIEEEHVRSVLGTVSRDVLFQYAEKMDQGDLAGLLQLIEEVTTGGADLNQFIRDLLSLFRDLLLYRVSDGTREPVLPEESLERLRRVGGALEVSDLLEAVDQLSEAEYRGRYASQPRFLLEMTTIRLVSPVVLGSKPESVPKTPASARVAAPASMIQPASGQPKRSEAGDVYVHPDPLERSPVPQETLTAADEELESVRLDWDELKERVRQENLPAHALLQPARLGAVEADHFVVVFDDGFSFHRERTENQNRELLEAVAKELTGLPLRLRCVFCSEYGDGGPPFETPPGMPSEADEISAEYEVEESSAQQSSSASDRRNNPTDLSSDVASLLETFDGKYMGKISEPDSPDRA